MKVCNVCHKAKPLDEFSGDKTRKDNLMPKCKQCHKVYSTKWYNDNQNIHGKRVKEYKSKHKDQHLKSIYKQAKKISPGVYQIKCMINGKRYIGKSVTPNSRKYNHFTIYTTDVNNTNPALQADMRKYGKQSFVFGIIEHCPTELLLEREAYYINTYKPEYNAQIETLK